MIQIPPRELPQSAATSLTQYQSKVDEAGSYAERVQTAKQEFSRRSGNATFRVVRNTLSEMCGGIRRCMYCEDSVADEVEHHRPKHLYPESVFVWDNYLYACGPCNGPKNNKFAVLRQDGTLLDIRRAKDQPIEPPAAGDCALIHPREEDPLRFIYLDIQGGTFLFVPIPELPLSTISRVEYTIRILGLNSRDYLPAARKNSYECYRDRLQLYVEHKNGANLQVNGDRLAASIRRMSHPTVWREMQRQRDHIQEIRDLFDAAPEALGW